MGFSAISTESITTVIVDSYWTSTVRAFSKVRIIIVAIGGQFIINNLLVLKDNLIKFG